VTCRDCRDDGEDVGTGYDVMFVQFALSKFKFMEKPSSLNLCHAADHVIQCHKDLCFLN
jgi:hypothetical protein